MFSYPNSTIFAHAAQARWKPKFFIQLLLFIAVFSVTSAASGIILTPAIMIAFFSDPEIISTAASGDFAATFEMSMAIMNKPWVMLISLLATAVTALLCFIYCRKIEGRSFASMGFVKNGWLGRYLKGFVIGAVMLFLCAAIGWATGCLGFKFASKIPVLYIFAFFIGFVIQGMSEEVMVRGYFMISLSNRCSVALAAAISSVVFSLLHLGNPGFSVIPFINITLFGFFMAVYILRTDDLWGACAIHSAWNFMQGNILGIQVSGTGSLPTVAIMEPIAGKELLNGGSFGIEGGLIVTAVTALAICLTLFLPRKKSLS